MRTRCKNATGEAIAASHYVSGATHPWPLTLLRRRRPSGRPWPGRAAGRFLGLTSTVVYRCSTGRSVCSSEREVDRVFPADSDAIQLDDAERILSRHRWVADVSYQNCRVKRLLYDTAALPPLIRLLLCYFVPDN